MGGNTLNVKYIISHLLLLTVIIKILQYFSGFFTPAALVPTPQSLQRPAPTHNTPLSARSSFPLE
jgi:hypothetical protein